MSLIEMYKENIDSTLRAYEDKSFEELLKRADEITDVLDNIEDLMRELVEIQGVLTARVLKGDVE